MRLAEVLGSLHYLRNLCGETGNQWRDEMEQLLASENPQPERRARFVASFNRGYRSFDGVYVGLHRLGDRGDQPLHEGRRGADAATSRRATATERRHSVNSLLTFPPSAKYRGDFLC